MLLAYDDLGPGPVVVLLHGFPLNRSLWDHQRRTVGLQYRLILPDLRGHGESASPDGVYTMDTMADDVMELLDVLQLREPVVLGGLSMGGYVALSLVERYPSRFRGLILMSTRAEADRPEVAQARLEQAKTVEGTQNIQPVVDAMLPRLLSEATHREYPALLAHLRAMMERTTPRGVAGALRGMAARPDRTALLSRIRIPTLALFGTDDPITTPDFAERIAAAVPDARCVMIPKAGHLAPWENPQAANAALLQFLDGLG